MAGSFAWVPTDYYIERSQVRRFMRQHGIVEYSDLYQHSIDEMEWFWDAVVADLGIDFFEPYTRVLDTSRGVPWSCWFVGGKINVAHNCVDRHAHSARAARTALIWEGEDGACRKLSYAELSMETSRLAAALKKLGVARGDRVAILLPMLPETVAALMACAKIGAIAIPVFSGFGAPAIAARLNDGQVSVLVTADGTYRRGARIELKAVCDEAASFCPNLRHIVVLRRTGHPVNWTDGRDHDWHALTSGEPPFLASEPMDSEDPWLLAYTSGTTGQPKGAVHVHGGLLVKLAQEVCHQIDFHDDDILCWVTDMGWIMGPWEVVGGLALGGTIVLFEGAPDFPTCDRLWRLIAAHGITILGLSPTLVRALMRHGEEHVRAHNLHSLRVLASTGEPWNPDPWLWYFHQVGGGTRPVINFSGGTEVGACLLSGVTIQPQKPCSLGGPALGMAVEVFDPSGTPIRGAVGELVCTRPWPGMTRGIWRDAERYLRTYWSRWPDVWTHGDWASIDEDGQWFLHGRSDDTIKVAGKRVGPAEIESAVVGHPAVVESAAIGVPHPLKGESIWCFVVLRRDYPPDPRLEVEISAQVVSVLGKAFAPDQIRFVSDLPKTRSAKILRRAIRARILGTDPGDLSSLENPAALDEIEKRPE